MIREDKVEQKHLDGTGVREQVERLSTLVSDPDSSPKEISSLSGELYQLLLAPFADGLPPSGRLIIDPDGELAAVPWNVLEEKRGHPLVERFAIAQVIGILDLGTLAEETQVGLERPLIFGPPVLSGELTYKYPFPHRAAAEADILHRLLPNSLFFQKEEANFQILKAYTSRTTLFHFAGHSISNGGFSALLLPQTRGSPPERQYATAEQIAELDLRQMKTVVLASCSSGTGEKYGTVNLDSLTRAFLEAGTQRVIAAGWDVNSARTEELMTAFYEHLKEGKFPAEALRQAELRVRQKTPHPHYWAGFQVFGEP
jgi:CHAT domain-containing protein